jgi:uncharacterized cupredoxin-like copper-binding protein
VRWRSADLLLVWVGAGQRWAAGSDRHVASDRAPLPQSVNEEELAMRKFAIMAATLIGAGVLSAPVAFAEGDLSGQKPITVRVDLGKDGVDEHKYYPDKLTFETGKLYKLVLHNPSNSKHYFTSLGLASKVWSRKVQVMDDLGPGAKTIGEIKGAIREIEVYPGGTTEWWFVPVATGTISDLGCSIKDKDGKTHQAKGMKGTITIM